MERGGRKGKGKEKIKALVKSEKTGNIAVLKVEGENKFIALFINILLI